MSTREDYKREDVRHLAQLGTIVLAVVLLAGCATGPQANPKDPLEPWNRGVYKFNDTVDKAVLKPVATAYSNVVPNVIQKGVRNFFSNLDDAWSAGNSLLQFKGEEAANNFWRFVINTTFGLGGIFDVATEARIPQVKQEFGLTLGTWGVPSGPYIVLPFFGASTVRDAVALPVDVVGRSLGVIDFKSSAASNSLIGLGVINKRTQLLDSSNLLEQAALDPYALLRDAYLQQRESRLRGAANSASDDGYEPAPDEGQDVAVVTTATEQGLADGVITNSSTIEVPVDAGNTQTLNASQAPTLHQEQEISQTSKVQE